MIFYLVQRRSSDVTITISSHTDTSTYYEHAYHGHYTVRLVPVGDNSWPFAEAGLSAAEFLGRTRGRRPTWSPSRLLRAEK